jgi:hypothetical protein
VLGVLSLAAVPAAILASRFVPSVELLESLYVAVPAGLVLGLLALLLARRGRRTHELRLGRSRGGRSARAGRWLALAGMYVAFAGAVALGTYAALRGYS